MLLEWLGVPLGIALGQRATDLIKKGIYIPIFSEVFASGERVGTSIKSIIELPAKAVTNFTENVTKVFKETEDKLLEPFVKFATVPSTAISTVTSTLSDIASNLPSFKIEIPSMSTIPNIPSLIVLPSATPTVTPADYTKYIPLALGVGLLAVAVVRK